ncbi:unnamed protein product [Vicia faba]|uniref:Uncharacterized protein n=1 Tax=Vicia faba TaxID=3906 RepID=A0AAV1B3J4_VICFA|nr:unnamed protein product [Vicia faba]
MVLYSIMTYYWPISLIKLVEGWCINFIWSANINKRKLVTVAWKHYCKKVKDGGLGLKSLRVLNEVADLRQCWSINQGHGDWDKIIKSRVIKRGRATTRVLIFWADNWCGQALMDIISGYSHESSGMFLKDYIIDNRIVLPCEILNLCPSLVQLCDSVIVNQQVHDRMIWKPIENRLLSLKVVYK